MVLNLFCAVAHFHKNFRCKDCNVSRISVRYYGSEVKSSKKNVIVSPAPRLAITRQGIEVDIRKIKNHRCWSVWLFMWPSFFQPYSICKLILKSTQTSMAHRLRTSGLALSRSFKCVVLSFCVLFCMHHCLAVGCVSLFLNSEPSVTSMTDGPENKNN